MAGGRDPQQVAKRALILGAIAFRASLELTDHPRVVELSLRLLPWLEQVGCSDELDPIERELLETPYGRLGDGLRIDANCAGEAASFFCWALGLASPLEVSSPADQSGLTVLLAILRPDALGILQSASLRSIGEIEDACRHFVLIQSILRETKIEEARDIVRRYHLQKLEAVGLNATEDAIARASETVAQMTPLERSRAAGFYSVRAHAALWFFSDRRRYFEEVEEAEQ